MATRRISVNVGGLWRTSVELKEEAMWWSLKKEIEEVTGISRIEQNLKPTDEDNKKCELEEGKTTIDKTKKIMVMQRQNKWS
jgi:hypothetical protein